MTTTVALTPQDIYAIACQAARTDFCRTSFNWEERVDAAYCAVAVAVWTSEDQPSRYDLIRVGREASNDVVTQEMRHHGLDKRGATFGEQRVNFARYWTAVSCDPVADRVVDRVSLAQIWACLTTADQESLAALAIWRDYERAAAELGLKYNTFCARVRKARRRFLALWHEGEEPSSVWGRDRLLGRDAGLTAIRVFSRRRQKPAPSPPVHPGEKP